MKVRYELRNKETKDLIEFVEVESNNDMFSDKERIAMKAYVAFREKGIKGVMKAGKNLMNFDDTRFLRRIKIN